MTRPVAAMPAAVRMFTDSVLMIGNTNRKTSAQMLLACHRTPRVRAAAGASKSHTTPHIATLTSEMKPDDTSSGPGNVSSTPSS